MDGVIFDDADEILSLPVQSVDTVTSMSVEEVDGSSESSQPSDF